MAQTAKKIPKEKPLRLDKFLTETAGLSRSEAKQKIKKGLVTVNGIPAGKPECKIFPQADEVCLSGSPLAYEAWRYLMLNKPAGVVSATTDPSERTVLDLIREGKKNLFPVGRLDKDTEGLLLITNDGELAHRLLSPGKHVDKTYFAVLDRKIGEQEIRLFEEGLDIGDEKLTMPARLKEAGENGEVRITIQEGRYHQIKRMAEAVGRRVTYLKRLSMGSLVLDETLKPGEYRPLTKEEITAIGGHHA